MAEVVHVQVVDVVEGRDERGVRQRAAGASQLRRPGSQPGGPRREEVAV